MRFERPLCRVRPLFALSILSSVLALSYTAPAQITRHGSKTSSSHVGQSFDLNPERRVKQRVSYVSDMAKRLQKQTRGQTALHTVESLQVDEVMTGLGDISSLALSKAGDIYVSDKKSGRIWRVTDRGLDGNFDGRSPICGIFDRPSGLALRRVEDETDRLYIADRKAIWVCQPMTGRRSEYVNLRAVHAAPQFNYPLAISQQDGALLIGVTTSNLTDGTVSKLIKIDPKDKSAGVLGQYSDIIHAISTRAQGDIWVAVGNKISAYDGSVSQNLEGFRFEMAVAGETRSPDHVSVAGQSSASEQADSGQLRSGHAVASLVLPGQYELPINWPKSLAGHIFATQSGPNTLPKGSSGGMNIVAIPTEFGAPLAELTVLVDGFLTQRGGTAWGRPSALVMDKRGLFFAENWHGGLWRVYVPKRSLSAQDPVKPLGLDHPPQLSGTDKAPMPSAKLTGTKITGSTLQGSSIKQGSQIAVGSYLIRDYEAKEAEKAMLEKSEKEALRKKRRDLCAHIPEKC